MVAAKGLRLLGLVGNHREAKGETFEAAGEKGQGDDVSAPWVVIYYGYDPIAARIMADILAQEGIPVRLRQEAAGQAIGVQVGMLGLIEILAPGPMHEKAENLLADLEGAEIRYEVDEADDDPD